MRLAVFDCDGTLVDGQADICGAMDTAFGALGLVPPPGHQTRAIVGLSLPEAMRQLHPAGDAAQQDALCAHYREAYRARRVAGQLTEPLYDGIVELIETLHGDGWLLGVATGKSDRGLRHCLASHGLEDRFVTLQTADRHPSKPHPAMALAAMAEAGAAPGETVFIGDTGWDMGCARAARVGAIGVGWGYHAHEDLVADGAHGVAMEPGDVKLLAEQWIGRGA